MWILAAMAQMAKNVMPITRLIISSFNGPILGCVVARSCDALLFIGRQAGSAR
jgi:hypothetical protein